MLKQVFPHETVIRLRMLRRSADVFVQVKRRELAPVEFHRDQFPVEQPRGIAGCQAKHGSGFFPDDPGNQSGGEFRGGFGGGLDDDFHNSDFSKALGWFCFHIGVEAADKAADKL